MKTTPQTSSTSRARAVLAWVLAVCAIVVVSLYEFAPQVLFSHRAQVGVSQDEAEAPAAPAVTEAEPSDSDTDVDSADSDSDAPAKKRPPLTNARAASQTKPGSRATR